MRSLQVVALVAGLALLTPHLSAAQDPDRQATGTGSGSGTGTGSGSGTGTASTTTVTTDKGGTYTVTQKPKAEQPKAEQPTPLAGRSLTNVQIELTITDQAGTGAAEKKTVTMVVSDRSWGKIRSAGTVRVDGGNVVVDLNVDARPFVISGAIQLELTLAYSPLATQTDGVKAGSGLKPLTVNQSLTVTLQDGKPLIVSQAADPVGDRKIIVEVKASVLK